MPLQRVDNMTDDLAERLKKGDLTAFDILYEKYFKLLSVSAFYYLQDENEALDTTQNLFLDIWEKKLYQNFHEDVKGYLFLAIRNRCFNAIKAKKRQMGHASDYQRLQSADRIEENTESPDQYYAYHLKQLLDGLKGQRKKALDLVYFQQKKYSEAAEEMGIGINSLKTHLKSALKVLRNGVKLEE